MFYQNKCWHRSFHDSENLTVFQEQYDGIEKASCLITYHQCKGKKNKCQKNCRQIMIATLEPIFDITCNLSKLSRQA